MKNKFLLLCFLYSSFLSGQSTSQDPINESLINLHQVKNNNENFEGYEQLKQEIGNAEIVLLGEQSHGDATTFETKIKLIKYLHEEMDFDILAFESNFYECNRAWSMIQKGHDVKDAAAKSIYAIWSTLEVLNPLYQYMEQEVANKTPLMIAGFDAQFMGKIAIDHFEEDLTAYLATFDETAPYEEEIQALQAVLFAVRNLKKINKKKAIQHIASLQRIIELIKNKQNNELAQFWIQTLKNFKIFISDIKLGTDNRDQQMAENLIWLKEKYPDKKIICWGATSHFLYNASLVKMKDKKVQKAADYYRNHSMMGDYLKKKYGEKVYTVGFIAYEGFYGVNRRMTIDAPLKNSLAYLIGQSANDNYFLSLDNISLEGYLSRPLGHQYMTNDIAKVMDGVVFNRYMSMPYTDWEFYFQIVPENKMWEKKKQRFIEASKMRKQNKQNN